MENFNALGLPQPLLSALEKMQFTTPTPIQAQAIPPALEGKDILGSAQTGTGKTGAFSIPLITKLLNNPQGMAIVMTPTRELAAQVLAAMQKMLVNTPQIKTALLIGGESMFKQLNQLKARPRIIVGTPGRINDHLERRSLNLSAADFLVLDETDRMLDMGFGVQIDRVLAGMPKQRQTLLFSATLPPHIVKIAERYMNAPVRIAVGAVNQAVQKIQQEVLRLAVPEKYNALLKQLQQREGSVIVFVKTKRGADRMAKKLMEDKHSAAAIHGNLNQGQRNRVIQAFRDKKHRVMVATDVAARGLDIPHIEHVINYDLPQVAEDYIHRIGRTARAGAEGSAICFITPDDFEMWGEIDALLNPDAPRAARPAGGKKSGGNKNPHRRGYQPQRSAQRTSQNAGANEARDVTHRRGNAGQAEGMDNPYAPKHSGKNQKRHRDEGRFPKQRDENRFGRNPFDTEREERTGNRFRDGDYRDNARGERRSDDRRDLNDRYDRNDRPQRARDDRQQRAYGNERPQGAGRSGKPGYAEGRAYEPRKSGGYKSEGYKSDGYKSDGYKSDKYKSEGRGSYAGGKSGKPGGRAPGKGFGGKSFGGKSFGGKSFGGKRRNAA